MAGDVNGRASGRRRLRERALALLVRIHADDLARRIRRGLPGGRVSRMRFPPYSAAAHRLVMASPDPVRYGTVALAVNRVVQQEIIGSFAEVGVYSGELSRLIHVLAPDRPLFLFDTFEGFPSEDLEGRTDARFRDTSVEAVRKRIGDMSNVVIRKGRFPETAVGLDDERFALVILDLDLYPPTFAGLEFFYPRTVPGGFIIFDDYNNSESLWGVKRAVTEFLGDKPEYPIEIADSWGTLLMRKG